MNPSIKAICFDVGGTLRVTREKENRNLGNIQQIQTLINDAQDIQEFIKKLNSRERDYRNWSRKFLRELNEAEIWSQFMLPDQPKQLIIENGIKLNQLWRESREKVILPDAVSTIKALHNRGYKLAIISNTTSSVEVPILLEENGITNLFSCVILSSVHGRRKPHPSLFLDCARQLALNPEECVYVGDMISRDVVGGRQAGFAEITIINAHGYSSDNLMLEDEDPDFKPMAAMNPDHKILRLEELLDIYPSRVELSENSISTNGKPPKLFDIALSTMWHVDQNIAFNETFEKGRQAGFCRFELNHRVNPALFNQWDADKFYISTVHDPCPAEFTGEEFKENDFLISSLDEKKRIRGLDILKKTVETAINLGSRSIVVHPGMIVCDYSPESRLKKMYQSGSKGTPEYEDLRVAMIKSRKKLAPPHVDQVLKSLTELIEFMDGSSIEVGLENRYHFYDIPLIDEMQLMLELCDQEWYGFQYDVGHAQVLSQLGFVAHEDWLKRFGHRIIGVHLQDVQGIIDHQIPGSGDIDYHMVKNYIPDHAQLTLEVNPRLTVEELTQGLEHLTKFDIISTLN